MIVGRSVYKHAIPTGFPRQASATTERRIYPADTSERAIRLKPLLALEKHGRALGGLVRARLVGGCIGLAVCSRGELICEQKSFDFFTTDIRQHPAIDFNAGAEHLAALFDHLLALGGVVDDIAIFERQIILAHDGANTLAPAAGRFEVSNDLGFVHSFKISPVKCHSPRV